MREITARLNARLEADPTITQASGYDVLAMARLRSDLYSMRYYDKLFVSGMNPKNVRAAVITRKLLTEDAPELTIDQVNAHTMVTLAIMRTPYATVPTVELQKLSLAYPDLADFMMTLVLERDVTDPEQIEAILAQTKGAVALHDGII
jgi:hypothetical protein